MFRERVSNTQSWVVDKEAAHTAKCCISVEVIILGVFFSRRQNLVGRYGMYVSQMMTDLLQKQAVHVLCLKAVIP